MHRLIHLFIQEDKSDLLFGIRGGHGDLLRKGVRSNAVAIQEQLNHYAQVTENVLQLFLDKEISLPKDDAVETIPAQEILSQTVQPKQVTFNSMEVNNG